MSAHAQTQQLDLPRTYSPQPVKQKVGIHDRINKILTTIALLLGILLMAATLYVGAEIAYRYIQLQNALQDIGATFDPGAAEGDPLQEVPDTGQDLGPFATTPLDVPTPDGTVCSEDGTRNVIVCEGPSADDGELYYNGAVID